MWRLSVRSVCHYWALFAGTFIALALGVALIGVSAAALAATWNVPQPSGSGNPSITLKDGEGTSHTLITGAPDMGGIQTVLVMAAVVSAFVTVFVIAGTGAFSVALRRRDMGLLRLVGAGGPQVRRMVIGESVAVAVPATLVGCAAAAVATPLALSGLNGTGLSPIDMRTGALGGPLLFAAACGFAIAVLGATAASRQAARTGPAEALREADLDSRAMTTGRGTTGVLLLISGAVMLALAPGAGSEAATPLALFGPMALTLSTALLGPLYLPPLVRLLTAGLKRTQSVSGLLAVEAVVTSRRRTASLVGPVLAIVAIVGTFTSVLATTGATVTADDRQRTAGQLVVEPVSPDSGEGLNPDVLTKLRVQPGVRAVSAPAPLDVAVAGPYSAWQDDAAVADVPDLARTHRVSALEGSVRALAPGTVAVSKEFSDWYGVHAGDRLTYGRFGGEPVTAEVTAVLDGGSAVPHLVLAPGTSGAAAPQRATVLLEETQAGAVEATAARLNSELRDVGVKVTPTADWFGHSTSDQDRLNDLVLLVLIGPASVYALIAVAGTLVMSYSRRGREIAGMRMVGVSEEQLRRMALWESLTTTLVGAGIAAVVITLGLWAYRGALKATYGTVDISVPWAVLAGLVAACLAVAIAVAVSATRRLAGRGAVAVLNTRQ
ncbi:FtsX-like permease family protein [Streptomyces sp. NBC_00259]|uniref:FtsX-like permease family protein n=1 Tax=Streptomyces sp. NBC_00259 TaxID=2903643 RepID=UPI002E2928B3|nr:FtsX-like permease family protein [Streptomyces sp. NBC_00259]